jgi:(2R)-ethylmalonyl-CoA mutase
LSIAFDLPTQTAYDSDHILARGEVGKVGVPVGHLGDMRALFDQIKVEEMNTSMTINAPAAWLLSLYVALADEQGCDRKKLQGTTQNDNIKEYLSRGTYVFPPKPSMRLIGDMVAWCNTETPKWDPLNVWLPPAGSRRDAEQELAFAGHRVRRARHGAGGQVRRKTTRLLRISFFVNAGVRFVTEMCKMRAFVDLWEEIGRKRYGVTDTRALMFRYGVQVNSLGLTEPQPENNVYRILIEALAVTLSKRARCRALQLPAWNEALGLPRPWDQQWSLRLQQILAYETDLLEYEDLFDGSHVVTAKTEALKDEARAMLAKLDQSGGTIDNIDFMKTALVESQRARLKEIEAGRQIVVGVNRYETTEASPLSGGDGSIMAQDHGAESRQIAKLKAWRSKRSDDAVANAIGELRAAAASGANIMPPSIAAAKAGVTVGEWGAALREAFGEYRGPTGVAVIIQTDGEEDLEKVKGEVERVSKKLGRTLTYVVGKPGLDGHSNGSEQIAARARQAGMNVIYEGIRFTPEEIVQQAIDSKAHVVGLSILRLPPRSGERHARRPAREGARHPGCRRRHHS